GMRQGSKNTRIDEAEDGGGRSDSKRQSQDRGKREAGTLADHPDRHAEVVRQSLEPSDVVHFVRVLTNAQCIAELFLCGQASTVERHPFGAKLIDAFGQVEVELSLEVAIDAFTTKRIQETSEKGHGSQSSRRARIGCTNAARAAGTNAAMNATARTTTTTPVNVAGSVGETPYSIVDKLC